jgi:hypothetical protein
VQRGLWEDDLSPKAKAGRTSVCKKGYVEYRAHIPKDVYVKLHHLRAHYRYTGKYKVRSMNDIILMAIKEFLERHKEDLASSADS